MNQNDTEISPATTTEQENKEQEPTITNPDNALPEVTRNDLPPSWQAAMDRAGWTDLMPVQSRAMPYVMAGRDLMVQSRTGSGKTGAFIMPILERINSLEDTCQALVLAPTRELAKQVTADARLLAGDSGTRVVAVYGGTSYKPQLKAFREGAHLVVGTPGRVLDHLLRRSLSLDALKILVFDEADRLLSMGFYQDMLELKRYLPDDVDGFMFSATFPPAVQRLARVFLDEPGFLGLSSDNVHVVETEHVFYSVPDMSKDRSLVRIIEIENPDSAIIFCNTKNKVHYVAVVLQRFGYNADELSSDLSQAAREKVLQQVRDGKLRFLVATDVAARGIDIPALSHVIQYEPPEDPELYIHRAGRTGRAGKSGVAITLVDFMESLKLKRIMRQYEFEIEERPLPADEDVADVVAERTTVLLEKKLRDRDKLRAERMARFVPLAQELSESDEGLLLLAMMLDDYYQETIHNPPPVPPPEASRKSSGGDRRRKRRRRRRK